MRGGFFFARGTSAFINNFVHESVKTRENERFATHLFTFVSTPMLVMGIENVNEVENLDFVWYDNISSVTFIERGAVSRTKSFNGATIELEESERRPEVLSVNEAIRFVQSAKLVPADHGVLDVFQGHLDMGFTGRKYDVTGLCHLSVMHFKDDLEMCVPFHPRR